MKHSDGSTALALTLIACAGAFAFSVVSLQVGEAFAIPVGIVALIAAAVVLRGPLGRALARRLEGSIGAADTGPLLDQMDQLRGRLSELEERLDFTERVLTQQREPDKLEG